MGASALLALLDALPAGQPVPAARSPPQRRQRTPEALKRVLLRESQAQPLLLVFEDLHWIDTETRRCSTASSRACPRPASCSWSTTGRSISTAGAARPIHATAARPAAASQRRRDAPGAPGGRPQPRTAQAPTDHAHRGQPLLSGRERADAGGDRGVGRRAGAYRLAQALPTIQVPATVQAVLAARIDRLPPEEKRFSRRPPSSARRYPCRCCRPLPSCRRTPCTVGWRTSRQPSSCTRRASSRARVHLQARPHAEVAYSSLLQERRRALHARIVEALEALAGDR